MWGERGGECCKILYTEEMAKRIVPHTSDAAPPTDAWPPQKHVMSTIVGVQVTTVTALIALTCHVLSHEAPLRHARWDAGTGNNAILVRCTLRDAEFAPWAYELLYSATIVCHRTCGQRLLLSNTVAQMRTHAYPHQRVSPIHPAQSPSWHPHKNDNNLTPHKLATPHCDDDR